VNGKDFFLQTKYKARGVMNGKQIKYFISENWITSHYCAGRQGFHFKLGQSFS